ncbi:tumor necrosis factor receptor superfamily member 14 isoform X1 [Lates calcarifer]|uniref:Tumor necrosis factor receptor superfamily member 14 isoform X1 n=1 Tax=Lates calcarifer TaxID=8187 RepID=A0AAJ8DM97_LATCA|nr:tumor necrosis factor receptor superfamily member 14 isoform X1 [Lates calcarifer]XP_050924325.1 tumor necrosis factor receptor superfamily member 14 isoform X1 [Lates calcarifer]
MTSRGKPLTAASLLILLMKVFSGNSLTCHPAEYQTGNECCPMCPPGSCVKTNCTEFRSTSCLPCLEGTYMNQPTERTQCFPCTNCDAGSGLKIKTSCTSTSDTVCEPLEGFYCMDVKDKCCMAAQRHKHCEPGQYISKKGTASTDTECSDCTDGTFSNGTFTSCQPHTQCESVNLQLIRPGTATTDAQCGHSSNTTVTVISIVVPIVLLICISLPIVYIVRKKRKSLTDNKGNTRTSTQEKEYRDGREEHSII